MDTDIRLVMGGKVEVIRGRDLFLTATLVDLVADVLGTANDDLRCSLLTAFMDCVEMLEEDGI